MRLARWLTWLLVLVSAAFTAAWWLARPPRPDAFYGVSDNPPPQPGVLLRHEPFERQVPANARAWRILHTTTRGDGSIALASAIVMVARAAHDGPRPVVAWAHGTTGVAPGCAPSLLPEPFAHVPALPQLIEHGWILVATDYVGLGTEGPHPYLIGDEQARSALDAVRAARRIEGLAADARTVVWGHSQGGHAALWAGIVAPSYASDVPLAGVAAAAPASDLRSLIDTAQHTPPGRMLSSFLLRAYSQRYADVRFDAYSQGWIGKTARDIARRCMAGRQALLSLAQSLAIGGTIFATSPLAGALGERLVQNTPALPVSAPLLIAQGLADDLVLPAVQQRFVEERCRAGQAVQSVRYAGRDHLSLVAGDSPFADDLIRWTRERFAGAPAPAGCSDALR